MTLAKGREPPRLRRLTAICLALPEATRELSGRHATFRVRLFGNPIASAK